MSIKWNFQNYPSEKLAERSLSPLEILQNTEPDNRRLSALSTDASFVVLINLLSNQVYCMGSYQRNSISFLYFLLFFGKDEDVFGKSFLPGLR